LDTSENFFYLCCIKVHTKKRTMKNIKTTDMMLSTYDSTVIYVHPYVDNINSVLKFTKIVTELVSEFAELVGVDGEKVAFEIPKKGYFCNQLALKVVVPNDWEPLEGVTVYGTHRQIYNPNTESLLEFGFFDADVEENPPTNPHNLFGTIIA